MGEADVAAAAAVDDDDDNDDGSSVDKGKVVSQLISWDSEVRSDWDTRLGSDGKDAESVEGQDRTGQDRIGRRSGWAPGCLSRCYESTRQSPLTSSVPCRRFVRGLAWLKRFKQEEMQICSCHNHPSSIDSEQSDNCASTRCIYCKWWRGV